MIPVITIDGPGGSGKGAIGRLLAKKLKWHFLDSGAVYRALALLVMRSHISLEDITEITREANNLKIEFTDEAPDEQKIVINNGEDITNEIRSEECGQMASKVSVIAQVRYALLNCLRGFRELPGLVADGRDMGTIVFSDALLKIFLTASLEERAKRRFIQLQDSGINANLEKVLQDLAKRDAQDEGRATAPLKPDPSAMIVDTTKLSIDEVLQIVLAHV